MPKRVKKEKKKLTEKSVSEKIAKSVGASVGAGQLKKKGDHTELLSADEKRRFRSPTEKPKSQHSKTKVQANFESRTEPSGKFTNNAHVDVSP